LDLLRDLTVTNSGPSPSESACIKVVRIPAELSRGVAIFFPYFCYPQTLAACVGRALQEMGPQMNLDRMVPLKSSTKFEKLLVMEYKIFLDPLLLFYEPCVHLFKIDVYFYEDNSTANINL
jgi:hypothetical protein